jgi:nicotinamide phosphoribosyltransferase
MILPMLYSDFYKVDHRRQYPEGTEFVYSNLTARGSRLSGVDHVVVFGIQYFLMDYLIRRFNDGFFKQPKEKVLKQYQRRMDTSLGAGTITVEHIAALHDLGYLPVRVKALPEGTLVPLRVPLLTIINTLPEFYWVTNFLETILSNATWHPMTAATIAHQYRVLLDKYAAETSDIPEFVQWQGHDFSMRGQSSFEASVASGGGHLLSFTGTDTIPAIDWLEHFYGANAETELIGGSVPATEHSVMCLGGKDTEADTYRRLITEVYPKGIVSIVSDTWDYFEVLNTTIRGLKDVIMARDGKVVIRPDSGNPTKIICGDPEAPEGSLERKGTIQILWDIFGGTVNSKGFKQLDPHIGAIYGDSITLDRCQAICNGLAKNGFASTNIVFGIGSYTYQYVTRDTFGFAIKATYGVVKGQPVELFKQPKTDNGIKNSAKGLLRVNADLTLSESVTAEEETQGLLETVFLDGKMVKTYTLQEIRTRLAGGILVSK